MIKEGLASVLKIPSCNMLNFSRQNISIPDDLSPEGRVVSIYLEEKISVPYVSPSEKRQIDTYVTMISERGVSLRLLVPNTPDETTEEISIFLPLSMIHYIKEMRVETQQSYR